MDAEHLDSHQRHTGQSHPAEELLEGMVGHLAANTIALIKPGNSPATWPLHCAAPCPSPEQSHWLAYPLMHPIHSGARIFSGQRLGLTQSVRSAFVWVPARFPFSLMRDDIKRHLENFLLSIAPSPCVLQKRVIRIDGLQVTNQRLHLIPITCALHIGQQSLTNQPIRRIIR